MDLKRINDSHLHKVADAVGLYQKLTPKRLMNLVNEVMDYHGELYVVKSPCYAILYGNGMGDMDLVKPSSLKKWAREHFSEDYKEEMPKGGKELVEYVKDFAEGFIEIEKPGLYYINDEGGFEAIEISSVWDLLNIPTPEYFDLNVSDKVVKKWIKEAEAKGDYGVIDEMEDKRLIEEDEEDY